MRSSRCSIERALTSRPSLSPGLGLPLVVPPLRDAVAKPTAKHNPPAVADLIAKAQATN